MNATAQWSEQEPGVVVFPSGARIRGRPRSYYREGVELPDYIVMLAGFSPCALPIAETQWIRWPDFWIPIDGPKTRCVLETALKKARNSRVDITCGGGIGRTGTALACIAVLDGIDSASAVAFIRESYHPRAVETPWQRWYISRFASTVGQ